MPVTAISSLAIAEEHGGTGPEERCHRGMDAEGGARRGPAHVKVLSHEIRSTERRIDYRMSKWD